MRKYTDIGRGAHAIRLAAAATLMVIGLGSSVSAQVPNTTTSIAIEHFEPWASAKTNILTAGSATMLPHLHPSVGLMFHYQANPLTLDASKSAGNSELYIEGLLTGELQVGIGFFDLWEISLALPMGLHHFGEPISLFSGSAIEGFGLGDLRLQTKVTFYDRRDAENIGVAIGLGVWFPTGDTDKFQSDGDFRVEPTLILDWEHPDGHGIAANIGYHIRPERKFLNYVSDDALRWSLGARAMVLNKGNDPLSRLSLAAAVFGTIPLAAQLDPQNPNVEGPSERATPVEATFALEWRPENLMIQLGGGLGFTRGVGAPDYRLLLNVTWADTDRNYDIDGDGFPDSDDQCPNRAEDKDGFEDTDGCPDPDNDKDGILDVDDRCPMQPEDKDGFEDNDGCPDPDNDKDGFLDPNDKCPNKPEDKDGFEDTDGCPDLDNDNDGIPDTSDKCPLVPEDRDGFEDEDGCPDIDNDQDKILDIVDKCPMQPETYNGVKDDDGCPDSKATRAVLTATKIEILDKVHFATNKATIKKKSWKLLREVAEILVNNPQVTKLRIEGHTDSRGPGKYNLDLSDRRAAAVRAFLLDYKVAGDRLVSKGFGEARPIASNKSGKGRANNRRVEFMILEMNGKPVAQQKGKQTISK